MIQAVLSKALAINNCSSGTVKDKPPKTVHVPFKVRDVFAWFDGASQINGTIVGVGGIIKNQVSTIIRWSSKCGRGTKSKSELIVKWATLLLVDMMSYHNIRVMEDSRVIIDYISKKGRLQVSSLEGWKNRILILIKNF